MKAASPVVVDLYRLAYNAGRPVTFDELVDGLPSAYQNDANRWWVAKEEAAGRIAPPDPWPATMLRSVKAEWVSTLVTTMTDTQRFSVGRADGRPSRYRTNIPRDQQVFSVVKEKTRGGRGGPPMVEEEVLVRRMVPWTPEIGATGRRHVAGIKFLDEARRIQALGAKATKHDLEDALALAVEALIGGAPS
jgi:hypothetical protein